MKDALWIYAHCQARKSLKDVSPCTNTVLIKCNGTNKCHVVMAAPREKNKYLVVRQGRHTDLTEGQTIVHKIAILAL